MIDGSQIKSVDFKYSSAIIPSPYLRRLGFSASDNGRFPFGNVGYSLHQEFAVTRRELDILNAIAIGVFAPEQAIFVYGPDAYSDRTAKVTLKPANLHGFSFKLDKAPGIRTLRELEAIANGDGLLGEVVAIPTL